MATMSLLIGVAHVIEPGHNGFRRACGLGGRGEAQQLASDKRPVRGDCLCDPGRGSRRVAVLLTLSLRATTRQEIGVVLVRWFDDDEWMAAKLVGLFGLILLALVGLYFLVMLS
jgi:hypothetical protein